MKELTAFINESLKPRLWEYIPSLFPELHFKQVRGDWKSNYHLDGSEGTGYKEDRLVITRKRPYGAYDNTRQEAKELITLFQHLNNIPTRIEAIKRICSIVGLSLPEYSPEQKERFLKSEQRRNTLEESAARQRAALFSPEGAETLNYMRGRGWTDEEIKAAELGFISSAEARTIEAQYGIGDYYTLSIPLRSGSLIYGFKFRTIKTDGTGSKYVYLKGTERSRNLFNLTGIQQTDEDARIVVVEGELDALHAQVKGISGIVATSGGQLTEELLTAATNRGIKRITLLFDKDQRGEKFLQESISIGWKKRVSVLVATFPEEELPNGTKVHDIDEYLQAHSSEELQTLIENAESASMYLLRKIIDEAIAKNGAENGIRDEVWIDAKKKVIRLMNSTPDATDRDLIASTYSAQTGEAISKESILAVADEERAEQNALLKKQQANDANRVVTKLLEEGRVDEALSVMEEALADAKKMGSNKKFRDLLHVTTRAERLQKFKDKPTALETSYCFEFGEYGDEPLPLTIPSGALTILAAPTSHGKSTLLRNLALDIAKRYTEKSVLYFTFEESEEDVIAQLTNTYIGKRLHAESRKHSQLESIVDYFKTGEASFIGGANAEITREEFLRKEEEFSAQYLDSGKIRTFYKDYDLETLIDALEYAVDNIPTRAIFIDYIQILRSTKFAKHTRTEQLKEICISLKDFSVKYKLPVVLAAQLTREAKTPFRMDNTQMSESSDIEKAANTIICVWNSQFKPTTYGEKGQGKDEKAEIDKLQKEKGFELGKRGKLFVKLTKRRGSRGVGMYSILEYKGYSGKVVENYTQETEQSLPLEGATFINPFAPR